MNVQIDVGKPSAKLSFKEVYVCDKPLSRLRGVFFRSTFTDQHAVLLTDCSAVHGVGITRALDVIFLDEQYRVLAVSRLYPFRMCYCRGATNVLELCVGNAEKLGIRSGVHLEIHCESQGFNPPHELRTVAKYKRQSGASMVEFLLVAPLLIFFGIGIVQMAMAYHARNILDYATFEAARVGAVHQADTTKMRGELAYRMGPMFPGDGSSGGVRSAVTEAIIAVNDPLRTHLRIINPTSAAFEDFGVTDPDTGELVIPSTHLQHRSSQIGGRSQVSIQDANLLKIEITHGYELRLPWLDVKLPGLDFVLRELMSVANPSNAQYYLRGQIPLKAVATVRMQSDAKATHVQAAAVGVTRPDIDELSVGEPPQAPDENLIDENSVQQTNESSESGEIPINENNVEQTSESSGSEGNISEECFGSHGLPTNLMIETISGEPMEGLCAFSPPEDPITESPLPPESNSGTSVVC